MLRVTGIWIARHPWPVIGFWVAVLIPSIFMAPRVTDRLLSGLGKAPTEAREAAHLLRDELGAPQTGVAFAISHPTLTVDDQEYEDSLAAALAPLSDSPDVKAVQSYYSTGNRHMVSGDGRTTYVNVMIDADPRLLIAGFSEFRDPVQSDVLDIKATGGLAIFADVNRSSERDLRRAEIITFPIVLLALIFVFRSVFAATLPLVMGGVAVGITLASIYLLAGVMDMSVFVLNVASFLGLGAAIDYLLVLVSRFREERSTLSPHDAIGRTMATAGRAIMLSAITSMLGLSGLLFFDYMMLRSLGVGGIIVVGVSVLTALTLLPALLSLLGDRLGTGQAGIGGERMWGRLASWVMRHPLAVLIIVGGFLIALGIPFLNVNVGSPWADILPPKAEARQGWTIIANEIGPSELAPILVVAIPDDGEVGLEDAPALLDLLLDIQKDPDVQRAEISTLAITGGAPISLSALSRAVASGNLPESLPIAVVRVYSRFGPADAETEALVKRLRRVQEPGGIDLLVGGGTADLNDAVDQMYGTFPWVIAYTMVAVYLALMILFRSLALPLKAVVMNSMSLFAAYGALVLIFQNGALDWLLGTEATGFTEMTVPILIFAVAFGLSVDYEVFLLSRVKEYWDETGDNRYAVQMGMEKTGRIVTSAALILVLVAGSFATADIVVVKALGIGTAIAIGLDASIVRALFVPAIMRLMGRANWWAPRFIR